MSTNTKLIFLAILVAAIWGIIGYRIYEGISHDSNDAMKVVKIKSAAPLDSVFNYELQLNYADPFLRSTSLNVPKVENEKYPKKIMRVVQQDKQPLIVIDWSKIEYLGAIRNASKKVTLASIRISGNEFFVAEGGEADQFVVSRIYNDSIKINFGKQQHTIRINKQLQ